MTTYHINIFYSAGDGGYIADVPDLAYCSAFGKTAEEALQEVEIAMKNWLAAAKQVGKKIPKARYRPAIYDLPSAPTPALSVRERRRAYHV